jgi:hypothetical protein
MALAVRDRISVDLRGLKAALFDQARARGVSPSMWVRNTLAVALGQSDLKMAGVVKEHSKMPATRNVRLSLRMRHEDAVATLAGAKAAGLAPGAFVAGLVAGVPVLTNGANRTNHLAALTASSAELSTLSRNIHRLATLLRQGDVQPALQYRATLTALVGDVRGHLELASRALADLRPKPRPAVAAKSSSP